MATAEGLAADSGVAELVLGFVAEIREEYVLGLREFVAVQELLLALAERSALPDDPSALEGYLCPILCSNRREQRAFAERYRSYLARQRPRAGLRSALREPLPTLNPLRARVFAWNALTFVLSIALIVAGVTWWRAPKVDPKPSTASPVQPQASISASAQPVGTPAPVPPPDGGAEPPKPPPVPPQPTADASESGDGIVIFLLSGGAVAVLALRSHWLRRRAKELFARDETDATQALDAESVLLRIRTAPWVSAQDVRRSGTLMRARTAASVVELDLLRSVQATAHRAGFFTEVRRELTRIPEYLFLLDRRHPEDFECARHDELLDQLAQGGTRLQRLYFDRDANVVFSRDRRQRPRPFVALEAAFHDHRVGIVADPSVCFDPVSGELKPWASSLLGWAKPVLFTSANRDPRLPLVERLGEAGIRVVDASPRGFEDAYGAARFDPELAAAGAAFRQPPPPSLGADARRWLAPEPPDDVPLTECLRDLRAYLGAGGYAWFSACALFPQMRWPLAVALLGGLESVKRSVDAETARRFTSLPWTRAAYQPDWLRQRLLADLPKDEAEEARRALEQVLVTAAEAAPGTAELPRETGLIRAQYRELSRRWAADPDMPSPLDDRLFVGGMQDNLTVRVPRALSALGNALVRRARVDLPPRDGLQGAYGALLLGYVLQLSVVPGNLVVFAVAAFVLAIAVAGTATPRVGSRWSPRSALSWDVATGTATILSAAAGALVARVDFGFRVSPASRFNVTLVAECLLALGFMLAIFRQSLSRWFGVVALLGLNAVYVLFWSHNAWNFVSPFPGGGWPCSYFQALLVLAILAPFAFALATAGALLARAAWPPWQRVITVARDVADRFAVDRLLLDRSGARQLAASRLRTAIGAACFGMVLSAFTVTGWERAPIWKPVLGAIAALAFVAFPHLARLRYRVHEGAFALLRATYEYAIVLGTAVALSSAGLWVPLGVVAFVSLAAAFVVRPSGSDNVRAFLERAAPDRLLGTDPALLGVGYLHVLVISLTGLLGVGSAIVQKPSASGAPPATSSDVTTLAGGRSAMVEVAGTGGVGGMPSGGRGGTSAGSGGRSGSGGHQPGHAAGGATPRRPTSGAGATRATTFPNPFADAGAPAPIASEGPSSTPSAPALPKTKQKEEPADTKTGSPTTQSGAVPAEGLACREECGKQRALCLSQCNLTAEASPGAPSRPPAFGSDDPVSLEAPASPAAPPLAPPASGPCESECAVKYNACIGRCAVPVKK